MEYGIEFLSIAGLFLSITNGTFLLNNYLKDKPKLSVEPVYPNLYQWWFELPSGEIEGEITKRYGFLSYVEVKNSGLRRTSLSIPKLNIKHKDDKKYILEPIGIPEPIIKMGDSEHKKHLSVLGIGGIVHPPNKVVEHGTSISGVCYHIAEYRDDIENSIKIKDGKIDGKIILKDIFDNKSNTKIEFKKKSLNYLKENVENMEEIISVIKSS